MDTAAKYGRGWTPTESKSYAVGDKKNGVFIRPGMPTEVPTKWGAFTVTLTDFGSREINAPEGYELPRQLGGTWTTLSEAIKAILEYERSGGELFAVVEQIHLPLSEQEKQILTRKGGAAA